MAASLPLSRALSSNPDVAKTAMDEAVAAFRAAIETGDGS
jgi:hypothetical protein